MTTRADSVLKRAMALDETERAEIAGVLLESLGPPCDAGVGDAWREEVRRRLGSLGAGAADSVPWEEVRERLFSRLNARS